MGKGSKRKKKGGKAPEVSISATSEIQMPSPSITPSVPGGLSWGRVLFGPGFVVGGLGLMQLFYWSGVSLVYLGFSALLAEVCVEPWMNKRSPWQQLVAISALLVLASCFTIGIVFTRAPLGMQVISRVGVYGPGSKLHEIMWRPRYAELIVSIKNPASIDYEQFDASLTTDLVIETLRQVGGLGTCNTAGIHPHVDAAHSQLMHGDQPVGPVDNLTSGSEYWVVPFDKNDKPMVPYSGGADWTYRIKCDRIPAGSQIELFGALVTLDERGYKDHTISLFSPPRSAKWATIKASYQTAGHRRTVEISECAIASDCISR